MNVKEPDKKPYKLPCFKDGALTGGFCDKVKFPTEEEVEKQVQEIDDSQTKTLTAIFKVKEHIRETGQEKGAIECPSCKGRLEYAQSSINDHTWGSCKCGVGWIE